LTTPASDRRQAGRAIGPGSECPDDLGKFPEAVIAFVVQQLDVAPGELARYPKSVIPSA
jgi:hypothetical protein